MPANLENSALAPGLKKSVFIPVQMKGNAKECSNYHTIALISHASKVMLKILQASLQQYMNRELPDVQAGFRKGRGTRVQIANIHPKGKHSWISIGRTDAEAETPILWPTEPIGSSKKQENSRKTSTSALLTMSKPLTVFSSVPISSVAQSCPTFCNPMDCSMPGFPVHCQLP